jgi:hypothetical protein
LTKPAVGQRRGIRLSPPVGGIAENDRIRLGGCSVGLRRLTP